MALEQVVDAAFSPDGPLARGVVGFRARDGQRDMALAVARTVASGGQLVVEAGTGVGKTFAYLVPVLLSGERALVSTATKTLQDQLFRRDLPRLLELLGVPARLALLKGRGSYLCLHRLQLARTQAHFPDRHSVEILARIERWATTTQSGDLAEVADLPERSPVLPWVTSTRENCLGSQCPQFRSCHVALARREALAADIVVINHHLFFADLQVRESGMAELLPSARIVVFDEAHTLNETGVQFLGRQLGTSQLLDFARDILAHGLQGARGLCDWQGRASALDTAARLLRMAAGRRSGRLNWTSEVPDDLHRSEWFEALASLEDALEALSADLGTVSELGPDFQRLGERAGQLLASTVAFRAPAQTGWVRWVDVGTQLRLVESPLDIAEAMQSRVLRADLPATPSPRPVPDGTVASAAADTPDGRDLPPPRAWIFTSATLGDARDMSWFTVPCGLDRATQLRVSSPFRYAEQAALYVPRYLPRPNEPGHAEAVSDWVLQACRVLGGRTLVLTTTLRALAVLGERLSLALAGSPIEVLVQGQGTRRMLIERFMALGRSADGSPGRGAVLVASASFWEGVDIPGNALQMVVIDKLPFPPPSDPLVQARSERIESAGRSAFEGYSLPEAAVALKQGAGRLIRTETDRGLLVVCDTRLVQMGYGRTLAAGLPPMRRLNTPQEADQWLRGLITRTSTTDLPAAGNPG